ncbi:MAG: cation transporter [Bacteroidetes bacterium]|nr:cation transporter [Bacteroidota bacterium]
MENKLSNIRTQKILVTITVLLFAIKITAWYVTKSIAILTDALESTVNVIAGLIGLYSLIVSSRPKDKDHPYGHGKVEFLSAAFEGLLISIAGLAIIYEAVNNLQHPHLIKQLDVGLILIIFTAVINYAVGKWCVINGKKTNSPALQASGKHLISDTYSTLGLVAGIALLMITKYLWLDSVVAIIFAMVIIYTGYKIIRQAISGIMDEADETIIEEIKNVLSEHRQPDWVDVHNMRTINYSGFYHIDCHITVPANYSIVQAHVVQENLTAVLTGHFKNRIEFFIHIDPCLTSQCALCIMKDCPIRQHSFVKQIEWTAENFITDQKHQPIL